MGNNIPKYQHIKDHLKNKILSGNYKKGDRFFTESELIQSFQVSSITIIHALRELEKEGYITRKQGLGTFISRTREEKMVRYASLDKQLSQNEDVTVLSITKGNDPHYLEKLDLHKTECYYAIHRARTLDQIPYLYQISYIPHDYLLNPNEDLSAYQSLYRRFYKDFGIQLMEESFQTYTDLSNRVPDEVKSFLQLNDQIPCVRQTKLTKARKTNRVLEYCELYKSWQYFSFKTASLDY